VARTDEAQRHPFGLPVGQQNLWVIESSPSAY
jgi:hypothetical protein